MLIYSLAAECRRRLNSVLYGMFSRITQRCAKGLPSVHLVNMAGASTIRITEISSLFEFTNCVAGGRQLVTVSNRSIPWHDYLYV